MNVILENRCTLKAIWLGVAVGFIVPVALATSALAEKMDLGNIPKDQVKGWCGAHNGQYLDWGGAGTTCTTPVGGAMYCDKDNNCTGYPPKTPKSASRQQTSSAFAGLGGTTGIMRRGVESGQPAQSTEAAADTEGMECVQFSKNAACFCSGALECELMKAKLCDPEAQACQTTNGIESCVCHVQK
jgi:hypothetical protein